MQGDLLSQLQAAQNDDEREEIVLRFSLGMLASELQPVVFAAAIPHWFDAPFLAAILQAAPEQAEEWLKQLQGLSFVEVYPERGWAIHERTRKRLLDILWRENQARFREHSICAAIYALQQGDGADHWKIEGIYHSLAGSPETGADLLCNTGWEWQNPPNFWYEKVDSLAKTAAEHLEAGRLSDRGSGWTTFWLAWIDEIYNRTFQAIARLASFDIAWSQEDPFLAACFYKVSGEVHRGLDELPQARQQYKAALVIYQQTGNRLGEASCLRSLGDVHYSLDEYPQARQQYEAALPIYRQAGSQLGEAGCLRSLGDVHRILNEYPQARQDLEKALTIYQQIGSQLGEANCLRSLGAVHYSLNENPQARQQYQAALVINQQIGHRLGEASCLESLGDIHYRLDEAPQARQQYQAALAIYQQIGDRRGEANCLRSLGDVHYMMDEYPQACQQYEAALSIYQKIGSRMGEANCLQSLGDVHQSLDEYQQAHQQYDAALSIYQKIGSRLGEASCLQSMGDGCARQGQYMQAEEMLHRARSIYLKLELPTSAAFVFSSLADLCERQDAFTEALEYYTQAVEMFSDEPKVWRNRANCLLGMRRLQEARSDLEQAARLQPEHAYLFLLYGDLALLEDRLEASQAYFRRALQHMPRLNYAHFGLGRLAMLQKDAQTAVDEYQRGLDVTDSPDELRDELHELDHMQHEHPELHADIQAIQNMLHDFGKPQGG